MAKTERRKVQRLRFAEPIGARVRARRVTILDLSTMGACIQHQFALKGGMEIELEVDWKEQPIRLEALVTRCTLSHYTEAKGEPVYHSGLSFKANDIKEETNLRGLIEEILHRSLQEGRDLGGGALPADVGNIPLDVWLRNKLK